MDKESLKIAREIIVNGLDKADMNPQDKVELLINLWALLDEDNYDHDINILKKYGNQRKNN